MNKHSVLATAVRIVFVTLLLGGILLLIVTGNDFFARVGVTGAILVFLLWWGILGTRSVLQKTSSNQYLDALFTALGYGGIALLLAYFVSILMWRMFDLKLPGTSLSVKQTKLALFGISITAVATVTVLTVIRFRRKRR